MDEEAPFAVHHASFRVPTRRRQLITAPSALISPRGFRPA